METRKLTESVCSLSIDFTTMLQMLTQPAAFQGTGSGGDWFQRGSHRDHDPITAVQTHASAVVLTASRVYKLKKPKNFGFFDYSTPALRRHFCRDASFRRRADRRAAAREAVEHGATVAFVECVCPREVALERL